MAVYSTNQFKAGLKVMLDGNPCAIVENEFVKPGKGQPINRVKFRNLLTDGVIERTFKSGDTLDAADVVDCELAYLYNDDEFFHFMDNTNFEQMAVAKAIIGDNAKWLKENDILVLTLWNEVLIAVTPPNFVTLKITETDPGVKGNTAQGGSKPATLETGAQVRVPLFVQEGELIKVDTRTGEYVSRAKE